MIFKPLIIVMRTIILFICILLKLVESYTVNLIITNNLQLFLYKSAFDSFNIFYYFQAGENI